MLSWLCRGEIAPTVRRLPPRLIYHQHTTIWQKNIRKNWFCFFLRIKSYVQIEFNIHLLCFILHFQLFRCIESSYVFFYVMFESKIIWIVFLFWIRCLSKSSGGLKLIRSDHILRSVSRSSVCSHRICPFLPNGSNDWVHYMLLRMKWKEKKKERDVEMIKRRKIEALILFFFFFFFLFFLIFFFFFFLTLFKYTALKVGNMKRRKKIYNEGLIKIREQHVKIQKHWQTKEMTKE